MSIFQADQKRKEKHMIKVSIYLTRRADTSPEEFSDYWRNEHAPLLLSLDDFTSRVRRYVQQYRVREIADEVPSLSYDGVAEIWLDQLTDLAELFDSPEYRRVVAADEEKFLDRSKTTLFVTTEHGIIG